MFEAGITVRRLPIPLEWKLQNLGLRRQRDALVAGEDERSLEQRLAPIEGRGLLDDGTVAALGYFYRRDWGSYNWDQFPVDMPEKIVECVDAALEQHVFNRVVIWSTDVHPECLQESIVLGVLKVGDEVQHYYLGRFNASRNTALNTPDFILKKALERARHIAGTKTEESVSHSLKTAHRLAFVIPVAVAAVIGVPVQLSIGDLGLLVGAILGTAGVAIGLMVCSIYKVKMEKVRDALALLAAFKNRTSISF